MSRRKQTQTSAEIDAEIRRLEEERARAIQVEDQRRGELLRGYLSGAQGGAIRAALERVVSPREAYLFGLDGRASAGSARAESRARVATRGDPARA